MAGCSLRFIIFLILVLSSCIVWVVPMSAMFSPSDPVSLLVLFIPILGNILNMLMVAESITVYVWFFVHKTLRCCLRLVRLWLTLGSLPDMWRHVRRWLDGMERYCGKYWGFDCYYTCDFYYRKLHIWQICFLRKLNWDVSLFWAERYYWIYKQWKSNLIVITLLVLISCTYYEGRNIGDTAW